MEGVDLAVWWQRASSWTSGLRRAGGKEGEEGHSSGLDLTSLQRLL